MAHAAHGDHEYSVLKHQFEDLEQQNDNYVVGMWTFLVTEIMFFGALFVVYTLYRVNYLNDWYLAHNSLDWKLGGVNTLNLLVSSLIMALAVRHAQLKQNKKVIRNLMLVVLCGAIFMGIKYVEYSGKIEHHLYPGASFTKSATEHLHGANVDHAQLFFGLYFGMTGLHGVHVVIGMLLISGLAYMWHVKKPYVTEDYIPTELFGLYWHFVDIVWIFLYPLFYLMPNPNGTWGMGGGH